MGNGDPLTILQGDALEKLRELPEESVQCCVTSPPFWGLRDYGVTAQLGLEKTPEEYVSKLVGVFREVRRVLRKDGTLWLNLGDSYAAAPTGSFNGGGFKDASGRNGTRDLSGVEQSGALDKTRGTGLKPKDLCGIPWMVAFALRADGWWLRSDIIWAKPNPMPESVTDRPTKSHEYLFLLTKSDRYLYDAAAIAEPVSQAMLDQIRQGYQGQATKDFGVNGAQDASATKSRILAKHRKPAGWDTGQGAHGTIHRNGRAPAVEYSEIASITRNKRSVWTVTTQAYPEAHFATYPPDLIKPCILAGTSARGCCGKCLAPWERMVEKEREATRPGNFSATDHTAPHLQSRGSGGNTELRYRPETTSKTLGWQPTCKCDADIVPCTVLDCFAGSGTTGMVAIELGRKALLIELNPDYVELIKERCNVTPGLALA